MTQARLDFAKARERLDTFEFGRLFIEELGWSNPSDSRPSLLNVDEVSWRIRIVAQLAGVAVIEVESADGTIPDASTKKRFHREISKLHHENLLIFVDSGRTRSEWYWLKRDQGKELPRPHEYVRGQPGDLFLTKVAPLLFEISDFESGDPAVVEVARRLKLGLDVEKVTKKFYGEFQQQHISFLELISGIDDERQRRWYASVLLNRLMFIWFLQRKGFVGGGDLDYLDHKLEESEARGKNRFFGEFLKSLFFEGFAKPHHERSEAANKLLGEIRYLNGGLFLPHVIEQQNSHIDVPDQAFANLFRLFRSYSWNLDDTPGGEPNEINPDVLGYIFEKYINQKAFGAYYTRSEITTYLCERTIHRLILDAVNTPSNDLVRGLPGKNYDFKSIGELKNGLDANLCRKLLFDVLPKLSILDPACGSGAFLVAAMKTLIDIYGSVIGQAKVRFAADATLAAHVASIERDHPNVGYYIKKAIITDNLYGVDIMEEAVEIAKLRLFLALVASARTADQLEPLPNIDFNLLPGNSLIGLMRVDEKKFDAQAKLFRKSYRELVEEKNRRVATYRHTASYSKDLRVLRDGIEVLRGEARDPLDEILLDQFQELGIKYEEASWDDSKQREGRGKKRSLRIEDIRDLQPFHWGYEFDEIVNRRGGFDAIITNPPWESVEPSAKEFFSSDLISKNKTDIKDFEKELERQLRDQAVKAGWLAYLSRFNHQREYFRKAPEFENQIPVIDGRRQGKDINLYKLFVERCHRLLRDGGECGIVIPSGIYTDLGAKQLREMLFSSTDITGLFGFENRKQIFENVDSRFKFIVLTFRKGGTTSEFPAAFMRHDVRELMRFPDEGSLRVSLEFVRRLSPDSLSLSEFRNAADVAIAEKLIRFPLLGQDVPGAWRLELHREFNMTDDAYLFRKKPGRGMMPLYEGKMIHQYDAFYSEPRYFIAETDARKALLREVVDSGQELDYQHHRVGYRDVARNTDERTMIAAVFPRNVFAGHTLHLSSTLRTREMFYVTAVLNSFVFDWLLRHKVSAHCSIFYVYQMPVPRLREGDAIFEELVIRAANLTCVRGEFSDLAAEVGIDGEDESRDDFERARMRAEVDAIVAHLYGVTADELRHILDTFPIVPAATKDLVLETYLKWKPPSDDPLLRLIASGESLGVEFKSSARWDYQRKQVNKDLELVIVKTIAALMNSDGGTLLIGVADNGTVLGLEPDYSTIGKKNADAYENWLMTRLLESIGRDRTRLIRVSFHRIEGREICRVDVERSRRPVFIEDRLFVRAGNSTRELTPRETADYCREHFSDKGPQPTPAEEAVPQPPTKQSQLMQPGSVESHQEPNLVSHGLFRKKRGEGKPSPEDRRKDIEDLPVEEILPVVRDVVGSSEVVEREEAIRQIAQALGAERTGSRIRDTIEAALNTASRRYIIYSDSSGLRPYCRTIDHYKRDDLKNVLRAVMGRTWTDEDEAIRAGARYLGFRRTGSQIEKAFRSAIKGGLRQGSFERSGRMLRASAIG